MQSVNNSQCNQSMNLNNTIIVSILGADICTHVLLPYLLDRCERCLRMVDADSLAETICVKEVPLPREMWSLYMPNVSWYIPIPIKHHGIEVHRQWLPVQFKRACWPCQLAEHINVYGARHVLRELLL